VFDKFNERRKAMATEDRGFASMDENKQKEIASKGGKSTGAQNLSHEDRAKGGKNSQGGGQS
jgi:uncharacterized protein